MSDQHLLKKIIILGSTGSIGVQALDIIRKNKNRFSIAGLACHSNKDLLIHQILEFKPPVAALSNPDIETPAVIGTRFYSGPDGLCRMIREAAADIVLNGIAGSSGLESSFAAVESGKILALANKETIVMAGRLIIEKADALGQPIIPVDSEHSAIFQLVAGERRTYLDEIILTASGGAFRDFPLKSLEKVTIRDALKHPNWNMGEKITIDSATMANKALEVIEAHHLFALDVDKIKVVIHPQSFVHSLIRTIDGSLYAQLSKPDMHIPIQNALTFPELAPVGYGRLDLNGTVLEFRAVDEKKYPLLTLGFKAARMGGSAPIVFNAANEIAVAAFSRGEISFPSIARVVAQTLEKDTGNLNNTLDGIIFTDKQARMIAHNLILKARL